MFVMIMILLSLFMVVALWLVVIMFSVNMKNLSGLNAIECGFMNSEVGTHPFSIHFVLLMVIFLVFDLELVLLLGVLFSSYMNLMGFLLIMLFVLGTFYLEWALGKLTWLV